MGKNVGKTDKIVRIVLGIGTLIAGILLLGTASVVAYVLFGLTAMFIGTALIGRCGLYKVFGINTCPLEKK